MSAQQGSTMGAQAKLISPPYGVKMSVTSSKMSLLISSLMMMRWWISKARQLWNGILRRNVMFFRKLIEMVESLKRREMRLAQKLQTKMHKSLLKTKRYTRNGCKKLTWNFNLLERLKIKELKLLLNLHLKEEKCLSNSASVMTWARVMTLAPQITW